MFSTLLIALREGLEAALIVGILVAFLVRTNRRTFLPFLWLGVGSALGLSLIAGAFLSFTSHELSERGEEIFAGTTSITAVGLVTWMVFWMKRNARALKSQLENQVEESIKVGRLSLVGIAFLAVAREGLETALFLYSNFKTVRTDSRPAIGLVIGLTLAVALGIAIYRRSIKLNLSKFFTVTGSALVIVAAGVLTYSISEFQAFNALPGGDAFAWNIEKWLPSDSLVATLLDGTIGFSTSITWLQLTAWVAYLGLTLYFYLAPSRKVNVHTQKSESALTR